VLGLLVFSAGSLMTIDQARGLDRALRSRGWRPTRGRILGATTLRLRAPIGWVSSPAVAYEYTVGGETFQSQTIDYRGSVTLGAAVRAARFYHVGRRVTVYYDPDNPSLAVLEPGGTFGGLVRVLLSGLVLWAGLRIFYGAG
jgi:hypothetical protein